VVSVKQLTPLSIKMVTVLFAAMIVAFSGLKNLLILLMDEILNGVIKNVATI